MAFAIDANLGQGPIRPVRFSRVFFGLGVAPAICCVISAAIVAVARKLGLQWIRVWIDDLIIAAPSRSQCDKSVAIVRKIIRGFGLLESDSKF